MKTAAAVAFLIWTLTLTFVSSQSHGYIWNKVDFLDRKSKQKIDLKWKNIVFHGLEMKFISIYFILI